MSTEVRVHPQLRLSADLIDDLFSLSPFKTVLITRKTCLVQGDNRLLDNRLSVDLIFWSELNRLSLDNNKNNLRGISQLIRAQGLQQALGFLLVYQTQV